MSWGGKSQYKSIDEALRDMEEGIKAFLVERGLDKESSSVDRLSTRAARRNKSSTSQAVKKKQVTEKPRQTKSRADKEHHLSEKDKKLLKKVEKLEGIAPALRQNEIVSVTRLTVIKGLCEDLKAAEAFALFLVRKIQRRMREKDAPKRYRELVNRAVRELKPHLDEPNEEREERLWSLFREIEAEQNEYQNIPFGVVRNIKSFDLVTVEHAVKAVLRPYEASFWLYHAARDYTGKTDRLIPKSAPMVEEIAGFWRKYFGVKG